MTATNPLSTRLRAGLRALGIIGAARSGLSWGRWDRRRFHRARLQSNQQPQQ